MQNLPVVGGSGTAQLDRVDTFTVNLPSAGSYPLEIDYFSTGDVRASLVLSVVDYTGADGKPPALSVYTGYADTEDPAGTSTFPSPFFGSPATSFVGAAGPYDTGLIRLDNHTDSACARLVADGRHRQEALRPMGFQLAERPGAGHAHARQHRR